MSQRPRKTPGPDHPISLERTGEQVVVRVGDRVVARSTDAVTLHEAGYPPAAYVPRDDVDASVLRASSTTSYCPYKGEADHVSLEVDGVTVDDAGWTYPAPYDAVADVRDHVAFYPDRVDVEITPA